MARKPRGRRSGSVRETAYVHIQRKIASGELLAGHSISELALARELSVSRTPIREALAQLAAEGVLDQSPNHRATVAKLSRQDIIDLYELREALETYAVGKVARQRVGRPDIERLQSLTDAILALKRELEEQGKAEMDGVQMRRFVAYDLGFHTLLMRLSSNARILKVVSETRLLIRIFAMRRRGGAGMLQQTHRQHSETVRALARQDAEGAIRAISEHIQTSLRERVDDFDQWEIETSLRQSLPFFFDVRRAPESD